MTLLLGVLSENGRPRSGSNSVAQIGFPAGQMVRLAAPEGCAQLSLSEAPHTGAGSPATEVSGKL